MSVISSILMISYSRPSSNISQGHLQNFSFSWRIGDGQSFFIGYCHLYNLKLSSVELLPCYFSTPVQIHECKCIKPLTIDLVVLLRASHWAFGNLLTSVRENIHTSLADVALELHNNQTHSCTVLKQCVLITLLHYLA